MACAPPPGEQPPHAPRRRAAPSRAAPGTPSGGPVSVGHQRYGNLSYRGLENLGFRPFWRFWPKSTLSGPMHTHFPHRWWPTDTGPPEGSPGAARDGAARRQGAWGGCSPGGGAHAIKSCVICACARTFWGVCLSHHASKYRKIYFRTIFSRLAPSEHVPTSPTSP